MTQPEPDPRVAAAEAVIVGLWGDLDAVPTARIEAQIAVDSLDRWDREHGVQRVTESLIRSKDARISTLESALTAAVLAFEQYRGPISVGSPDDVRAPSIAVPTRTVERWRIIAEGGS